MSAEDRSIRLAVLAIKAIDELSHLVYVQKLIKISLDQFDISSDSEDTHSRVCLLLDCYLIRSENHFDQLRVDLERIRLEIVDR